jgi:hypothetical protein
MKPRLLQSGLTGRVYVVTKYRERDGNIEAQTKYDVTDDYRAIVAHAVPPTLDAPAPALSPEAETPGLRAAAKNVADGLALSSVTDDPIVAAAIDSLRAALGVVDP